MSAVKEHEINLVPATDHAPSLFSLVASDFQVPTGREEEWRFTPLKRLAGLHTESTPAGSTWNLTAATQGGVSFNAHAAKDSARKGFTDRVAASAWENASDVAVLTVEKNADVAEPIVVSFAGDGSTNYGQLDIVAEQFARATVVIDHTGNATLNANVDIRVADGAQLTVVSLQDWDDKAIHTSHHRLIVGRDARVKHVVVTLGGNLVRILPSVEYTAPGGDAELIGLYFAGANQHAEHRLFVDHSIENCRSNVTYKGALNGEDAHTVWVGDVLIRAKALGTETYEINRNLVLGKGGRADSVPNLEIETGEIVGAGHASTTGRFDDEQLFYLMSRGISEEEARNLVLRGFFDDVLNQINVHSIDDRVRARIEEQLEDN